MVERYHLKKPGAPTVSDTEPYEVGRGKPPKHTQFKPGQSGNPNGRPPGARNLLTDVLEELRVNVAITENGRALKLPKQRVIAKSWVAKAAKGDTKAISLLLATIAKALGLDPHREERPVLAEEDEAIIAEYLAWNSNPDTN
jgi:hypothetical protein